MIQPHGKLFPVMPAHHPSHLLNVGGQGLRERTSRDSNHHIGYIETLRENVSSNQAMYLCVRFTKLLDHILLILIVIPITDIDKVIATLTKLLRQVSTMSYTGTEHNRLCRLTKDLVGLFLPLHHNIPSDLHATLGSLSRRPLARYLLSPIHVYFFGNKYF